MMVFRNGNQMTVTPGQPAPSPEINRWRGAPETNRRGAPRVNRNALKSGRYTAEAKAERKRNRLLLRQLWAGLACARSVIQARAAAERLFHIPLPVPAREKNFKTEKQFRDWWKKFSKIEKQFPRE
jgi:hypothetical protein